MNNIEKLLHGILDWLSCAMSLKRNSLAYYPH